MKKHILARSICVKVTQLSFIHNIFNCKTANALDDTRSVSLSTSEQKCIFPPPIRGPPSKLCP